MKSVCLIKKLSYLMSSIALASSFAIAAAEVRDTPIDYCAPAVRISLIQEQIIGVSQYSQKLKAEGKPVRLILGVDNGEPRGLDRFDDTYVFLNYTQTNPKDTRSLSVNFNKLEELRELSHGLHDQFDMISVDDSTFKFTKWTSQHLELFKQLLRQGGNFIYAPDLGFYCNLEGWNKEWFLDGFAKKVNKDYSWAEVAKKIIEIYPFDSNRKLIHDFDLIGDYLRPHNQNADWDEFKKHLENAFVDKKFVVYFNKYGIVPHNHIPILEGVFGQGNVIVEYDKRLPCSYQKNILITTTKS